MAALIRRSQCREKPSTGVAYTGTSIGNTRSILFMEFSKKDLDGAGAVKDPTGNSTAPFNYFRLMVDDEGAGGYDNKISIPNTDNGVLTATINQDVNTGVAVWSINGGTASKKQKALTTW